MVTRAAARQRRGRAGRTKPGECYKLFTRRDEENMRKFPVPEILRVPLESLSLQIKVMREDEDAKVSRKTEPNGARRSSRFPYSCSSVGLLILLRLRRWRKHGISYKNSEQSTRTTI